MRSEGSMWITHKRKAIQRVIDRYGAYMCHLATLSEDSSLKNEDRACIAGYHKKWSYTKILIDYGLEPPSIHSLTLQGSELDIVLAMKQILKTSATLKSLMQLDPLQWPTVNLVLDRLKDKGHEKTYQGAVLKNYSFAAIKFCKKEALADLKRVEVNMLQRLEWSDVKLLRALLVFIETQSWIKKSTTDADDECEDASMLEIKLALEDIFRVFIDPLQINNVSLTSTLDDLLEIASRSLLFLVFLLIVLSTCGGVTVIQSEEQTRQRGSHIDQGHRLQLRPP